MPVFEYAGLTSSGKRIKGVIDAETLRGARVKLRDQGVFPSSITESRVAEEKRAQGSVLEQFRRVGINQIALATRQLSTLVGSGMPLVDALKALGDLLDHALLKRVIAEVTDRVNEGIELAEAMRAYPRVFSRLYVNMISAGQANGRLDLVLERLADLLEGQAALRRKVGSALTYPLLMLALCFLVVLLLLAYVVPEMTAMFQEKGGTLPLPTQIVIAISDGLQAYWYLLLGGVIALVLVVQRVNQTPRGREFFDNLKLRIPIAGPLGLKIATARFARNLGTLLESEVQILEALQIVKNIVGNVHLEAAIQQASDGVKEGRSLSRELERSAIFPRMLIHMIAAGEQSGERLAQMLLRAANAYENEVNSTVSALTSILEPLLIVFLAVVVGGILISVLLPMLEMSQLALR